MSQFKRDKAKDLYVNGQSVYQFINGYGYKRLAPKYYYSSHSPAEVLFERSVYKCSGSLDDFVDEEGYTEWLALCHAEKIGVYSYEVDTSKKVMKWISYYGIEGFVSVTYNLVTEEETRKNQKSTKKEYNYFCG